MCQSKEIDVKKVRNISLQSYVRNPGHSIDLVLFCIFSDDSSAEFSRI